MKFVLQYSFGYRIEEATRIMRAYPDRIPVVCEKEQFRDFPTLDKKKYLVPKDITVGQFIHVIRKRLKLPPDIAMFLLTNGVIPNTSSPMDIIYSVHKAQDNFLYITYTGENTFGKLYV